MGNIRYIFSFLTIISAIWLTSCISGGPVSNAPPEGGFCCKKPLSQGESVVLKGDACVENFRAAGSKPVTIFRDEEVKAVSFPFFPVSKEDKDSVIQFLKKPKTIDVIKEYNIRYLIYIEAYTDHDPFKSDLEDAVYSTHKYKTTGNMTVFDVKDLEVVGSLRHQSVGIQRTVPLLLLRSKPDTKESVCKLLADSALKLFEGNCDRLACSPR